MTEASFKPIFARGKMGKFCKGVCSRIKVNKPFKSPYKLNCMCRRCGVWIPKSKLINNRCSCCNFRPKMKSYKKSPIKHDQVS
jgi:hypothetical protein